MDKDNSNSILVETLHILSAFLDRKVLVDLYLPPPSGRQGEMCLLLINDGQDLQKLHFLQILQALNDKQRLSPLVCAGIHCGPERRKEYGTASQPDYKGRGGKAGQYTKFVFEELLPTIRQHLGVHTFTEKAYAGFSLGGLSALDIVWSHPQEFSRVGVFSGSLWWRAIDQDEETYSDDTDRIMHQLIRRGGYYSWLKFFFECGAADEGEDRNNNGIIDSIDDTLDLIRELRAKGYRDQVDIRYLLLENGKHDIATWALAWPDFLLWGWGQQAAQGFIR